MQFEHVPAELRALPQWTVWRAMVRQGSDGKAQITKPPYRSDDPLTPADVNYPHTWGTYEQAMACWRANPQIVSGIGFMLTQQDPYVVWDVDNKDKVPAGYEGYRDQFITELLGLYSYTEVSPSGAGLHVWCRGQVQIGGRHLKEVGVEFYAWPRFITVTGQTYDAARSGGIVDGQAFINKVGLGAAAPTLSIEDDAAKPLHLTDDEVLVQAHGYSSNFWPRYTGQVACDPGEWSHTFVHVIGILDRITGNVEQLRRLVYGSGMVLNCVPSGSGETRPAKARRTFAHVLSGVRRDNRGNRYFIDHGREVWAAICAENERKAAEVAEKVRQRLLENTDKLSKQANALLNLFPDLDGAQHTELMVPPGMVGEFVLATEAASHAPFLKYSIPATLAALSGVTGRLYKTASGSGINLNFVLAAPSATGKTETMRAWGEFMSDVMPQLPHTRSGPPRSRIVNASASSIQGIITDFQETPACAWFIEECKSQLDMMSNCRTSSESALRDSYNQLYDCSKGTGVFSVPRSVASRNANISPIPNLSVSTFWTTTTSKFDVLTEDALDGFLSRVIVIRHKTEGGALKREAQPLAPHLRDRLAMLMTYAQGIDDEYASANNAQAVAAVLPKLVRVDDGAVRDLDWRFVQQCEAIKNASLRGELPPAYTATSRLPQTAMRIASMLAVVDNPHHPTVTAAQLKWAFGYLLQNAVSLLSDMDMGEVGENTGDEALIAKQTFQEMVKDGALDGQPGISKSAYVKYLSGKKPFRTSKVGRYNSASQVVNLLIKNGQLTEVEIQQSGRGRNPTFVLWQEG